MSLQVGNVEFDGDRITLTYLDDKWDLRNKGLVMQTHQLTVLRSPAYADEIDALEAAVQELLHEALDDFRDTEPATPVAASDVDDEDEDDA